MKLSIFTKTNNQFVFKVAPAANKTDTTELDSLLDINSDAGTQKNSTTVQKESSDSLMNIDIPVEVPDVPQDTTEIDTLINNIMPQDSVRTDSLNEIK